MSVKSSLASILIFGGVVLAGNANAGPIFSAVSATVNSGGSNVTNIIDTLNQNGLITKYTSGVTDFDTYIAGNPRHTVGFTGEWFSDAGMTTSVVTYNFGGLKSFDKLALWNEEGTGIGSLTLLTSNDGITFTNLVTGLSPANNLNNISYGAEVFSFGAIIAQYVRFNISGCPQQPSSYNGCAIGEVAFREADASAAIPEPASLALLAIGLVGLGAARRRKSK